MASNQLKNLVDIILHHFHKKNETSIIEIYHKNWKYFWHFYSQKWTIYTHFFNNVCQVLFIKKKTLVGLSTKFSVKTHQNSFVETFIGFDYFFEPKIILPHIGQNSHISYSLNWLVNRVFSDQLYPLRVWSRDMSRRHLLRAWVWKCLEGVVWPH